MLKNVKAVFLVAGKNVFICIVVVVAVLIGCCWCS